MSRVTHNEQTDQRLRRIADLFDEVNLTYFEGVIPTPTFHVSTRLNYAAGKITMDQWSMVISAPYHDRYGWDSALLATLKHECIHLWLAHMKRPDGHTREFLEHCTRIGATRWSKPMPRRPPRFLVQCPRCGARQYRGSWGRNIACGACCDRYNQGRFSPEFVLTLVERKNDEQTPPAPRHNVSLLSRPRQRLVIPAQLSLFGEEQAV